MGPHSPAPVVILCPAQPFCRIRRVALLFCFFAVPSAVFTSVASNLSQDVQPRSSDIIHRPTSQPYTGDLSIFEDPQRDKKLQVNRVMDLLGIHRGSAVADIGAGSGWFSVRAPNIRTILSKSDDPLLPSDSIDAVLLMKTYHEVVQGKKAPGFELRRRAP
jgi:hypothetical protein